MQEVPDISGEQKIKPITMPGVHKRFLPFFKKITVGKTNPKILDFGAGHGAFSKILFDKGYQVVACDKFPEIFQFDQIECHHADLTKKLSYEDNSFDIVIAIEVMEHIFNHDMFFQEISRILKPGGQLIITTPNILSLKSRMRFLFSGIFYSFEPLNHKQQDGLQHVAALTYDQFKFLAESNDFDLHQPNCDKFQKSSRWLMILKPFIYLFSKMIRIKSNIHSDNRLLLGRLLFLNFIKR